MSIKSKKINYRFTLIFLAVLIVFNFFPMVLIANADSSSVSTTGLVPCGTGTAGPTDCTWPKLVKLAQNVVNFVFMDLIIPLSVIVIVWAGIQILIGKSQPASLIKEKGALRNVAIGLFMALGSYVIVYSILSLLSTSAGGGNGFLTDVISKVFGNQ